MKRLLIFIIIIFLHPGVNSLHPIHVSVTNIEYVDKNKIFDISFKIYTDDFENIISHKYGIRFKIDSMLANGDNKKYINQRIKKYSTD